MTSPSDNTSFQMPTLAGMTRRLYEEHVATLKNINGSQSTPLCVFEAFQINQAKRPEHIFNVFKQIDGTVASSENTNEKGYTDLNVTEGTLEWVRAGFQSQYECAIALSQSNLNLYKWLERGSSDYETNNVTTFSQPNVIYKTQDDTEKFAAYLKERGYRHAHDDNFYMFDKKNNMVTIIRCHSTSFEIYSIDKEEPAKVVQELSKYTYIRKKAAKLTTVTGINERGLQTRNEELDPEKIKIARSEFYPWMNGMSIQEYFYEYMASDANVLVFYGVPGTGKSTLIQTGVATLGLSALLCADAQVSSNPEFVSKLGSFKEESGAAPKWDLIIVEDGDALMTPRTKGNAGLSSLLSATDGLGSEGKFKLVITTNATDTSQIDPALLRPGRCFDVMEFGRLEALEACAVRKGLNLPHHNFTGPVTLASALNVDVKTARRECDASVVEPRFPLKKK